MFPLGLPGKFSLSATFRMINSTEKRNWHLVRIVDNAGNPQFSLRLDGITKRIILTLLDEGNSPKVYIFETDLVEMVKKISPLTFDLQLVLIVTKFQFFDELWHKIQVEVNDRNATLYIDCEVVDSSTISSSTIINREGNIEVAVDQDGNGAKVSHFY